ncbi:hypothetical protein SAMD00023353_1501180 [Rosellinia necatrix]|uniref:Uncharacterized protein n=1 Tax=Rosellinia necatrix TaxID=77044 RepID=A0A1W2TIX4_ROSNE|nr:hypothetical protein SAMD00023353_1501180 [Rosellinia necatrix]
MVHTRRSQIPIEGSWRMVEGENDSFDTTLIRDSFDDDFISSGQSQLTSSSQGLPSQGFPSQDSIRDFADNADEDQVILRAPFQPSLSSTRQASTDKERTPVPEFFMPTVSVSPRRSSRRSSRTVRYATEDSEQIRRRILWQESTDRSHRSPPRPPPPITREKDHAPGSAVRQPSLPDRFADSVPEFLFNSAAWILSVIGMALRIAKWPVAASLALYLTMGAAMIGKNAITQSVSASFQPICRLPGVSLLNLELCPVKPPPGSNGGVRPLEFDELMNAQSHFEKVLEDSAQAVSLPMEMKRTEASVRDLRTMVKYSDLPSRDELVYEFDGYIDAVRQIVNDLQSFNTHVGGAVDSVIGINRWTSRYIDSVAVNREARSNLLSWTFEWVFTPFLPVAFDERIILEKYIEHTAFVSNKIEDLILEAQAILRLLGRAEDHLQRINEYVVRNGNAVQEQRNEVFWNLWTLVGANNDRLHKLRAKLDLLRQVEVQRSSAVTQLLGLVHDLGDIQTKLSDLRDRVAAPELLADTTSIPLSVHIETINAGVERLEGARVRIRALENERLQEALARGKEEVPMIDG